MRINFDYISTYGARACIEEALRKEGHLRAKIPAYRGDLTQQKILRWLKKNVRESASGAQAGWRFVQCFDTPQELADHTYWHGSGGGVSGGLRPSITMSDRELGTAGGGYGEKYWGISVSKSKNSASNFTGTAASGSVYMVVLHKDAAVREMADLQDASEIEEHLIRLWKDRVDAVWIGGGEEELVVLNPKAVWIGPGEYFRVFNKKKMEQPAPDALWNTSRSLEGSAAKEAVESKRRFLKNNVRRWEDFARQHPTYADKDGKLEKAKAALAEFERGSGGN